MAPSMRKHPGMRALQDGQTWPTPTASEGTGPGHSAQGGKNLRTVVAEQQTWLTPRSRDWKGPGYPDDLPSTAGGSLNPTWVEGLMGFPHGWTAVGRQASPA
jgi:hypothetical protein